MKEITRRREEKENNRRRKTRKRSTIRSVRSEEDKEHEE